jgi:hypothetical protein
MAMPQAEQAGAFEERANFIIERREIGLEKNVVRSISRFVTTDERLFSNCLIAVISLHLQLRS